MQPKRLLVVAASTIVLCTAIAITASGAVGASSSRPSVKASATAAPRPANRHAPSTKGGVSGTYTLYYVSYSGADDQCEVLNFAGGVVTGDKGDIGKYSAKLKIKWTTDKFLGTGPLTSKYSTAASFGAGYYGAEKLGSDFAGASFGPMFIVSGDDPLTFGSC